MTHKRFPETVFLSLVFFPRDVSDRSGDRTGAEE